VTATAPTIGTACSRPAWRRDRLKWPTVGPRERRASRWAGRILEARGTLAEIGAEIFELIQKVAAGEPTKSEALGHQEFILGYKSFEPLGPSCLPV
jgi:hypothetical protein